MSEAKQGDRAGALRRFKPYPANKDSGVGWLGEIPAHWEVKRLKFVAHIEAGQSPPSEVVTDGSDGLPFLQGNADFGPANPMPRQVCDAAPKRARAGDILLSVRAPVGALNIADQEYGIGRGLCAIGFSPVVHRRFGFHLLATTRKQLDSEATGSTYDAVTASDVGDLPQVLPEEPEQRAIAAFLDRETARIDALVAKKERLIELLQEQRTALITRAVTKGLDATVPMKDSGVEWLGEIPAHWEVKRLKHLLAATKGAIKTGPFGSQLQSSEMQAGDIKVYNQRTVLGRDFSGGDNYVSLQKFAELRAFETFPGDLLITTRGSIGRCAVLPEGAERGILHPCLMRVQPDKRRILTRFLEIQIEEAVIVLDQLRFVSNATTIDVIYSESLREVLLTVPPMEEQAAITAAVNRETTRIDALVAKVREAIERLEELRTSLISAAVTGKIDVREEVA